MEELIERNPMKKVDKIKVPQGIKKAFDAIQALVDFADMVADAHGVCEIKKSSGK